jgi:hypothetical protein
MKNLPSDELLRQMRFVADPLADAAIAEILGDDFADTGKKFSARGHKIDCVNRQFATWRNNQCIQTWDSDDPTLSESLKRALQSYLKIGSALPTWADQAKINRAEALFMEHGPLSCILLFCASLPECYVVPDLSAVLHVAGQLETRTDHRIRSTAAMIFPVMMESGLKEASDAGSGIAQILKVRLIHATIRHLILRGSPEAAIQSFNDQGASKNAGVILPNVADNPLDMKQALFAHGWRIGEDGLPCNQEELVYTLLTFGYVFLRSMRRLGIGLPASDEEAYLHLWNVVGFVLGIREELMPHSMDEAKQIFEQIQARAHTHQIEPDPRPHLGNALMASMEKAIPINLFKHFPVLMTRYLCGTGQADKIGVANRAPWWSRFFFWGLISLCKVVDAAMRIIDPQFALSRLFVRTLGYHLMSKLLLDQTRPLNLPEHLNDHVNNTVQTWGHDPKASKRMNQLEDRLTTKNHWMKAPRGVDEE